MITGHQPVATVVITTRNRCELLLRALRSCERQSVPVEVIVVDDASTDDTLVRVQREFPTARVIRHQVATGYIRSRNEAARLASTPFLFSIDDDAEYSDPRTVERALACFGHARVAGLSMPYDNVGSSAASTRPPPDDASIWVAYTFVGTAYALRTDRFLEVGGYDESFVHQTEEIDLCERLRREGYVIRLVDTPTIRHYESATRDLSRQTIYGARNALLIGWRYAPRPQQVLGWCLRMAGKVMYEGIRHRQVGNSLRGLARGVRAFRGERRTPLGAEAWALSIRLRRRGAQRLADIEPQLASLGAD